MKSAMDSCPRGTRPAKESTARKQIRGSSLLLIGRFLAIGLNFATQVLMVRYLSTTDYGALAYGLALTASLQIFMTFGLRETVTRSVAIYHEKQEYAKVLGSLLLAIGTILVIGFGTVFGFLFLPYSITSQLIKDQQPIYLLSALIFLGSSP